MRGFSILPAVLLAGFASTAISDEAATCFGRTYDRAHLDANPRQNVRDIRALKAFDSDFQGINMRIIFRDDPREFTAYTGCYMDEGRTCGIDCDGGTMQWKISDNGDLRLTTTYLRAETNELLSGDDGEAGCAEPVTRSIADDTPGDERSPTVFILYPRDERECNWQDG